jgi:hypothetical protein
VARRDEDPKKRDIFLLTALIVILSDFVKVMDYLWWRYKTSAHAQLLEDERQIMMQKPYDPGLTRLQELLDLGNEVTSEQLHRLNKIIFPLTRRLGDLKHDCLTVNIARDAIHRQLEAHWGRILRGAYGTHFVADVEWVAEQMASDIAYFDTATQCGTAIMSALKIKAEVENTHAQHLLRVANLFIASLAIGISSTVGAWTIAHSITSVYASKVVTILDVVTILVPAVISLLVGWLIGYSCWRRWRFGRPGGYAAMRKWVTYDLARSIETPTNPQESHTRVPHTPGGTAPGQG